METLKWSTREWLGSAHSWIESVLKAAGRTRTGTITQPHIRPWSTALRIPTDSGTVWFKAGTDALIHEARLTRFLSDLAPEHTPKLLAMEPDLGWMLMEDFGHPLREEIGSVEDLSKWHEVLIHYVALQVRAGERLNDLLATGLMDRRGAGLKREWDDFIADEASLMVGQPDGLAPAVREFAESAWPAVEELLDHTVVPGIPDTVVHEDLHDANVFRNTRIVLSDWGDSSVSSPLTTLTVFLRSAAYRRKLDVEAEPIRELRDCYLTPWFEYADESAVRAAVTPAIQIGALHRALTWRRAIQSAPPDTVSEWRDAVPGWLDEFLGGLPGCPGPRIP